MYSRLLIASALSAGLVAGVNASDWSKDPDVAVDPSHIVASILQLDPPIETAAESLDTILGTGGEPVGMDEAAVPASSSSWGALFVDDDHAQCPNAMFTSIQAAINASGPNATIKVCPGTYAEQVRIDGHLHDGLKLESLKSWQATIKWPVIETPPLALVSIHSATRVTVRDFTISGPFTFAGCSPDRHEGVLVDNAFDAWILHNHITTIQNSNPLLFGCQEGDAVSIGRRTLVPSAGSARVEHNAIDEYQKNGVQVVNRSSARVTHNVITGSTNLAVQAIIASNGVVVFGEAAATVDHNVISNNNFTPFPLSTGIILDESPLNSSRVDHNLLFDNDFGIETDTQVGLEISHNDLFNHRGDAIMLCGDVTQGCGPAMNIKVMNNNITANAGSGITLLAADANLLRGNYVNGNGTAVPLPDQTDGIRLDANSANNRLSENRASDNVTHDCHDDSIGTAGTAGTENFWINNKGNTENRPGLCKPDQW